MATLHPPERRNEAQVPSSSQPTGAKSSAPPADDADEETGCGCTQLRPTGPRPWTGLLSIGLVLLFCVGWRTTRVCYGPR